MLSHTRNRQSRWIKVATAPMAKAKPPMAKAKPEVKAKPNSQSQTHSVSISNSLRQHVKRHKSLIRNANWTNKTMYSVSIVTYNGIRTTLLYILRIWYNTIISNVEDSYVGSARELCFNGWWFKPIEALFIL